MAKLGLKGAVLASALLFLPVKAKANYLANLSINEKEYISEKDEKMFEGEDKPFKGILLNCENHNLEELVLRTFIEEEKENVEDEIENLDKSMLKMFVSPYTNSRLVINKLNIILKAGIPTWALAFQDLNPKFLAMQYGVQAREIAENELKNVDILKFERREGYGYYSNLFNKLVHLERLLQANREFIDDVRESTKNPFFFTHEEISDVKNALKYWNIKNFEIFAGKKIEEYKELSKVEEKKWEKIKETPEYKKYAKNLSFSKKRINLYSYIQENYRLLNNSCKKIEKKFPVDLYYNSMHGPKKVESMDLNIQITKSEINDKKDSWRVGIFSKDWQEYNKNWFEKYRVNFSTAIWVLHPGESSLDGIIEKSFNVYTEDDMRVGGWKRNLKKEENVGDTIKNYAFDEIVSHFLRGYKIKTENVAEWIVWKIGLAESENNEKKRHELLERFKGYVITEIPIHTSGKIETAKYLRFKLDKNLKDSYIFLKSRIEKGTFDNLAYGELEELISLSGNEEYEQPLQNIDPNVDILAILDRIKVMSLDANPEMRSYEILEVKKVGEKNAEAIVEFVMDYKQGMLPMYRRLTQKNKIYLEKRYVEQEGIIRWKSEKEDAVSVNWSDVAR